MHDTEQDRPAAPPPRPSVWVFAEMAFWFIADFLMGIALDAKRSFQLVTHPYGMIFGVLPSGIIGLVIADDWMVEHYGWKFRNTYESACSGPVFQNLGSLLARQTSCEREAAIFSETLLLTSFTFTAALLLTLYLCVFVWRIRTMNCKPRVVRALSVIRWIQVCITAFTLWQLGTVVWQLLTLGGTTL